MTTITTTLKVTVLGLGTSRGSVDVQLSFDSANPVMVQLSFTGEGQELPVVWKLGREIFSKETGIVAKAEAQTRFRNDDILLTLMDHRGSGKVHLLLSKAEVDAFIAKTEELVPAGEEFAAVDFNFEGMTAAWSAEKK